jgi:hypothetical protein
MGFDSCQISMTKMVGNEESNKGKTKHQTLTGDKILPRREKQTRWMEWAL